MGLTQLSTPYPVFTDKNGTPLDNGYVYFGVINDNPETAPIQVYFDPGLTQPAAQPLRTSNGYIMRNGSPAILYAASLFSVTLRDKNGALVVYAPAGYGTSPYDIAGPASAEVVIVAGIAADVTAVAAIADEVEAVGAISADVTTVAGIAADVTAVAGDATDIGVVAANIGNVNTVAGISANVTTVAGISAAVTAVAADSVDIGVVAANIADVNTVAGVSVDVSTVAANNANVTTVAGIAPNVTTVAGIAPNVTTVAGIAPNVTTVAGISSDVTIAAANSDDITNFASVYQGPYATAPSVRTVGGPLQVGDLYFNTTTDDMWVWDGATWLAAYASLSGALMAANNLSDLDDAALALQNLGLTADAAELNTLDGITGVASQVQAEAGTDNETLMTPLRTAEAIATLAPPSGVQAFTASGSVAAGDIAVINTNGTASKGGKVISAFEKSYAFGGTMATASSNEWPVPGTLGGVFNSGVISLSDALAVSVFWDSSINTMRARLITVGADGTLTAGSPTSSSATGIANWWRCVKVASDRFAFFYSTGSGTGTVVYVIVGQVSGSTITFGSAAVVSSGVAINEVNAMSNGAGGILVVQNTAATNTPLRVCAVSTSGTTASVGGFTNLRTTAPAYLYPTIAYDPVNAVFLLNAVQNGTPWNIWSIAITISGTTISSGSFYNVFGTQYTLYSNVPVIYEPSIARFVCVTPAYTASPSLLGRIYTATISSLVPTASAQTTDVSVGSKLFIAQDGTVICGPESTSGNFSLTFDPLNSFKPILTPLAHNLPSASFWQSTAIGSSGLYVYQAMGTGVSYASFGFSNVNQMIGSANSAASDGQTVQVAVNGGIGEGFSGLSASKLYFATPSGGLSITGTAGFFGVAVDSTKILVNIERY